MAKYLPPQNPCSDCRYRRPKKHGISDNPVLGAIALIQMLIPVFVVLYLFVQCQIGRSQPEAPPPGVAGYRPLVDVVVFVKENIYDCAIWYIENAAEGINCVDYAILFWTYCGGPDNPNVKVMRIRNGSFDHLYIRWYGYDIEPTTGDPMGVVWGSKYDKRYASDITDTCRVVPLYP